MHYFSRLPSDISPRQGAFLALLLPAPTKYYRYFARRKLSRWATARINRILLIEKSMGLIEEQDYRRGMSERLWGEPSAPPPQEDMAASVSDEAPETDFSEGSGALHESGVTIIPASPSSSSTNGPGNVGHSVAPSPPTDAPHVRVYQDEPTINDMQGGNSDGSDPLGGN